MKPGQTPELIDSSMIVYHFESKYNGEIARRQFLQNMMIKKPAKHSRQSALSLLLLIYLQLGPTNTIREHFATF